MGSPGTLNEAVSGASLPAHTPGPWVANGSGMDWQIDAAMDAVAVTTFCYAPEAPANARLIAAAPDLLASLAYFVGQLDAFNAGHGSQADAYWALVKGKDARWAAARAAIAKATGR